VVAASPLKRLVSIKHIVELHHKLEAILLAEQLEQPLQEACDYARAYAASVMLELFHWQAPRLHITLWKGSILPAQVEAAQAQPRQLALAYWEGYARLANQSTIAPARATAIIAVAPDPVSGLVSLALRHTPALRHPNEGTPVALQIDVRCTFSPLPNCATHLLVSMA
jgi:hypothetical protein